MFLGIILFGAVVLYFLWVLLDFVVDGGVINAPDGDRHSKTLTHIAAMERELGMDYERQTETLYKLRGGTDSGAPPNPALKPSRQLVHRQSGNEYTVDDICNMGRDEYVKVRRQLLDRYQPPNTTI